MFKVVERLKEKNEIFYPKKIREAPPLSPPVHVGEERATSKFDNHGLKLGWQEGDQNKCVL